MKISMLVGAAAILALAIDPAFAAPCHTGPTVGNDPTPQTVNTKSSDVDKESQNLAGGSQPASPGTVGAMNNVGADQDLGRKKGSETKINEGDDVGTSSKNLAGGQQPAYPGTIGALNNAGVNQELGGQGQKGDGC